jgi:hypothetical protein
MTTVAKLGLGLLGFVVALAAIMALSWWVLDGSTTLPRVVRSRLTIVVDTPEGVRSGSSVTQLTTYFPGGLTRAQGWALMEQLVGEAVVVDLGARGMLFSTFERQSTLLHSGGDAYNAGLTPFPQEKFRGEHAPSASINEQYAAYLDDLNRLKPKSPLALEYVPALVRFGDLNDPTSVASVNPLDLAASFGYGVIFKGVTVEITDDPIRYRRSIALAEDESRGADAISTRQTANLSKRHVARPKSSVYGFSETTPVTGKVRCPILKFNNTDHQTV